MAITQEMCNSFKTELLTGEHNFTASSGHTFKIALFTSSATLNKSTTAFSSTNETSGTGYSSGGQALTSVTPTLSTDTAVCDFSDVTFSSASITANGALIYNTSTSPANKAVAVLAFGSDKTASNGDFTIQFPAAGASTAIIRIA
tara:strand:+ start:22 stop:456 length:435 start_codon:yes stop_codon:yes gene_type:complete